MDEQTAQESEAEVAASVRVVWGTLAEHANNSGEGRLNILGAFDVLLAPSFPYSPPRAVFVFRLRLLPSPARTRVFRLAIVSPDGEAVFSARTEDEHPEITESLLFHSDHVAIISRWVFPEEGEYTVQLSMDGAKIYESALYVVGEEEEEEEEP